MSVDNRYDGRGAEPPYPTSSDGGLKIVRLSDIEGDPAKWTDEQKREADAAERDYRRGYVHGAMAADEARERGYRQEKINRWLDRLQEWRSTPGYVHEETPPEIREV